MPSPYYEGKVDRLSYEVQHQKKRDNMAKLV